MSEERLERIEGLLTDLIGKVAVVHGDNIDIKNSQNELKEDVAALKADVVGLKEDVSVLKDDVALLKDDVTMLKGDVAALTTGQSRIEQTLNKMAEDQISICEMFGDHEIAIRNLRRQSV